MPTIQVGPGSDLELQLIADALGKSRKVVVVTGAGISTNCGIPDFRSENGLYSMIQAQYDAALQNPPWELSNTFDIDDRPKKKRRQWYYEVVAPDGKVVDVIDEELQQQKEETGRPSRSRSTKASNSRSSSENPVQTTIEAPNSQPIDDIAEELQSTKDTTHRSSRSRLANTTTSGSSSSRSKDNFLEPTHDQDLDVTDDNSQLSNPQPRRLSQTRLFTTVSRPQNPPANEHSLETSQSQTSNAIEDESRSPKEEARRSSRSRSTNTSDSRCSTPKSTESSLTSLSSTTPELPETSFQLPDTSFQSPDTPFQLPETSFQESLDLSLNDVDQSTLSQTEEKLEPSTQTSSAGATGLSRTSSGLSTTRTLPNLKGRDLFDCRIWASPFETSIFYMFISSLREKIQNISSTTETHKFLRVLRDGGKLVRNYTQNIDLLEQREGLCQDLEKGPGSKGRFSAKSQKEARLSGVGSNLDQMGGCEVVPLHGSLLWLRCNLCGKQSSWDEPETLAATYAGTAPDCQRCAKSHSDRTSRGRRGLAIGRLRPDIVLYGEEHPHSNLISPIVTHDLSLGPDVLLIMGTSLRVHGLKVMIREFAKAVHTKGGKVVFINQTKPSESIWGEFIDYWVEWDCDEWVMDLRDRREDIWTGVVEEKEKLSSGVETKRWRPQALRDDKTNGVYFTFKILDTLRKVPDVDGQSATRFPYWSSRLATRVSDVSLPERRTKAPVEKVQASKRTKKAPSLKKPSGTKPKSNKRKAPEPEEDTNNSAYLVAKIWKDLRKKAPSLPAPPPELRLPFNKNKLSNIPNWYTHFAFDATSNHIPNVGGSPWPLEKMNLVTHPPSGADIPIHTPKAKPKTEEKPKIKHSYGTRASRRFSTAETIVVDNGDIVEEQEAENTIVVTEDPMTPSSKRIKRSCSIGALVSSSPEQWHDAPEVMT